MSKVKDRIVTYTNGSKSLGVEGLKLHARGCQHLRPNPAKPYTGDRKATRQEMATHENCKVC